MSRARYSVQKSRNLIVLIDANDGAMSITNDAEAVVQDLVERGYRVDNFVIVYRDTMGRWDQIVTADGRFKCLHPLVNKDSP
jgi:hypothetical protein